MTQTIAFLRAINVGKRRIKMAALKEIVALLDIEEIETFIASGNVIFKTSQNHDSFDTEIEAHLLEHLGYEVDTFLRTTEQLANVAAYQPFDESEMNNDVTLYVAFLKEPLTNEQHDKLMDRCNDVDGFHVNGTEVYWLRRRFVGESKFSGAKLEKTIKAPATFRNMNTIHKLVKKYC